MKFKDALRELIDSRDDDLIIVKKINSWQVVHPDDCPNYQLYDMYDYVDAGMVFGVLRDVLTPQLLSDLTSKLS